MDLLNEFEQWLNGPEYKDQLEGRELTPDVKEFIKETERLQNKTRNQNTKAYYEGVLIGVEFMLWLETKKL